MDAKKIASSIIDQMIEKDEFSQWLGIQRLDEGPGYCKLQMNVNGSMLNGFKIAHGGISFSLADSAFAFASNSRGQKSYSIEISIAHTKKVFEGDTLIAEAKEIDLSNRLGRYGVVVKNQKDEIVALFNGTVYRSSETWSVAQ